MKRFLGIISIILFTVVSVSFAVLAVIGNLQRHEEILAQCGKTSAKYIGRYKIINAHDITFLIDTATGETWRWAVELLPNGNQSWGWENAGFFSIGKNPETKGTNKKYGSPLSLR